MLRHLRRIAIACRWRRRCREPAGERMHGRRPQRCRRPSPDGRCKAACIGHEATIRQVSIRRHGSTACHDEQQTLTLEVICCGSEFDSMQEVRCSKGSLHDATSSIEGQALWQQRCWDLSAPQVPAMTMPHRPDRRKHHPTQENCYDSMQICCAAVLIQISNAAPVMPSHESSPAGP